MSSYTQQEQRLGIETGLGEDHFLLVGLQGREEVSQQFNFTLDLLSEDNAVDARDLVGHPVSFWLRPDEEPRRHFHGMVRSLSRGGTNLRGLRQYKADIVPWSWFLSQARDCRIFQDMSVTQIIEDVLLDYDYHDFDLSQVKGVHEPWEYCVQYSESPLNFICRLMEKEGISYYFRHEADKHVMVMVDGKTSPPFCREKSVAYSNEDLVSPHVSEWNRTFDYRSGKWAQNDYNFKIPTANLNATTDTIVKLQNNDKFELYEYPGSYQERNIAHEETNIRMQETEVGYDIVSGNGNCSTFTPGHRFALQDYGTSEDGNYVIRAIEHHATLSGGYLSDGHDEPQYEYSNSFQCFPDSVIFRPGRITEKPHIQGPQTAVVVGPEGEQVHTDEFGRVKVQFHWDRVGEKDDKSSCWIRVSQSSAGQGWGTVLLPHIGHEVVVSFLDGDPDRPLITGRVYNSQQHVPVDLPDAKYVSVISRDHFGNEVLMDGTPGREHVCVYAPNHMSKIELGRSCKTHSASNNDTITGGDNRNCVQGASSNITVGSDYTLGAGANVNAFAGFDLNAKLAACTNIHVGFGFDFFVGGKLAINAGFSFTHTKGVEIKTGASAYERRVEGPVVIDSKQSIAIATGPSDESFMKSTPDCVELSFGRGDAPEPHGISGPLLSVGLGTAGAIGAAIATSAQKIRSLKQDADARNQEKPYKTTGAIDQWIQERDLSSDTLFQITDKVGLASLTALTAAIMEATNVVQSVKERIVKHAVPRSNLRLHNEGVYVETGSATFDMKHDAGVTTASASSIKSIVSSNSMELKPECLSIRAKIDHPFFEVSDPPKPTPPDTKQENPNNKKKKMSRKQRRRADKKRRRQEKLAAKGN